MMTTGPFAEKPEPVTARIARIVASVPGWTPPDELLGLHLLAVSTAYLGGDIVEVGSWCGRSTVVLGHAAAEAGGHVWAIDLFPANSDWRTNSDGSHSFSVDIGGDVVGAYEDQTVWDDPFQSDIATVYNRFGSVLDAFNASVAAEGLGKVITPFRGTAGMFVGANSVSRGARLAFLDGDHSYAAVCADIDAAEQLLLPGGWIAFDDAFSVYDGVDAAIRDRILSSPLYEGAHQLCRKFFVARRK
jgi:hypothetical protein